MKKYALVILFLLPFVVKGQIITTYAGNGTDGWTDGLPATLAEISSPAGIYLDNANNLFICHGNALRRVDWVTGIISTIAGSDTAFSNGGDGIAATCSSLVSPYSVCVDAIGNIYIADNWFNEIRKVTIATGIIDTFAGTRASGNTGDGGPAKHATFDNVYGVCVDTTLGYVYISDEYAYRVRKVNLATGIISEFAGSGTNGYSGDGGPATAAEFSRILGICTDKNHNVYICEWENERIRKVDTAGIITTYVGSGTIGFSGDGGPATSAMVNRPDAVCMDSMGNLYFTDDFNNRVRRVDGVTKTITTIAGNGTAGYSGDGGPATNAEFNGPDGIAIDRYGNIYVADFYNNRVRIINKGGTNVVITIQAENRISIFPNPAQAELTIQSPTELQTITITNLLGQIVYTGEFNDKQATINIEKLQSGVYFVRCNPAFSAGVNGWLVGKLIKE